MGTSDGTDMEGDEMSVERPEGLIVGSGQRGELRRLDQMISARLDPVLVAALKELAAKRNMSLSDVLREAATLLLKREESSNVIRFEVSITNEHPQSTTRSTLHQDVQIAV